MSSVQLTSSALERLVARRTFPLHARTSVCRSLFGPVDHDELNREMKSSLREMSERDQRRWNFNFETDTPLAGAYQWEESSVNTTPAFYQDSVQMGKLRTAAPPVKVRQCPESCPQESSSSQDLSALCEDRLVGSESSTPPSTTEVNQENCAVKLNSGKTTRKQVQCPRRKRVATTDTNTTHITDFFVKRRRVTETKATESTCQLSSSPISIEQTPRKRIRWRCLHYNFVTIVSPADRVEDGAERWRTRHPRLSTRRGASPGITHGAQPTGLSGLHARDSGERIRWRTSIQTKCSIHGCFAYSHLTVLKMFNNCAILNCLHWPKV